MSVLLVWRSFHSTPCAVDVTGGIRVKHKRITSVFMHYTVCPFRYSVTNVLASAFSSASNTHLLYQDNGDGTFKDVSVVSGIAAAKGGYGLTAVVERTN